MNERRAVDTAYLFEELLNEGNHLGLEETLLGFIKKHGVEEVQFAFEFLEETAEWADEDAEDQFNRLWSLLQAQKV